MVPSANARRGTPRIVYEALYSYRLDPRGWATGTRRTVCEDAATMRPTGSLASSYRAEVTMDVFDFDAEAELFPSRGKQSRRHPVGYRRFAWQSHAQVAGCFSRLGIIVAAGATATEPRADW